MLIAPACSSLLLLVACHVLHPAACAAGSSVRVEGVVREGGQPLEGAWLLFMPERMSLSTPSDPPHAISDCDGCYVVRDLEPGTWRVTIIPRLAQGRVPVLMGPGQASDVSLWRHFDLTIPDVAEYQQDFEWPIADLSGRVSGADSEQALAQVPIVLDPEGAWKEGARLPIFVRIVTDAKGCFRVRGLLPGRYTVQAAGPGDVGAAVTPRRAAVQTVEIVEGQVAEVALTLTEASERLSGQVLDPHGAPKRKAAVHVFGDGGVEVTRFTSIVTDRNGSFAIAGLDPGSYTVLVDQRGETRGSDDPGPTLLEGVVVRAGEEARVELRTRESVQINVHVRCMAQNGDPGGPSVSIFSASGIDLSPFQHSHGILASFSEVELDEEGNVIPPKEPPAPAPPEPRSARSTIPLEPGRYTIVARLGDREERRDVEVTEDGVSMVIELRG